MSHSKIAIIGLGYVGLDLAVHLAPFFPIIGFDIAQRINELQGAYDHNHQFFSAELNHENLKFSADVQDLKAAQIYIVCVPTPVLYYKIPDLELLKNATTTISKILKTGDTVIYESSVYPGTTNSICLPILEHHSKLNANKDFFLGYSQNELILRIKNTPLKPSLSLFQQMTAKP